MQLKMVGSITPIWLLTKVALILLCSQYVTALYFLIDGTTEKCFYEDLPKDTIVVGDFKAEAWSEQTKSYYTPPDLGIYIHVDEIFDNYHRVVSQKGDAKGRFTFTAADAGEHRVCFQPTGPPAAAVGGGNLLVGGAAQGGIKFGIDLVIGETSHLENADKGKLDGMVQKVKDLNARLQDIRREQVFQREREAEFRDQSETTNSRVVRWTLLQLVVLGLTCAWQLSHLRSFFIKQKLT